MLKIKDDVDLKELENFGFEETIEKTYIKRMNNSDNRYATEILVNPLNKEIENQIVYYINNNEEFEEINEDDIDLTGEIDVLYDLIQAGLVEKIGD